MLTEYLSTFTGPAGPEAARDPGLRGRRADVRAEGQAARAVHRGDEGRAQGEDAEVHRAARRVQRRQEGARPGEPQTQVREDDFGDGFGADEGESFNLIGIT